jgi:hypothetical protein
VEAHSSLLQDLEGSEIHTVPDCFTALGTVLSMPIDLVICGVPANGLSVWEKAYIDRISQLHENLPIVYLSESDWQRCAEPLQEMRPTFENLYALMRSHS